MAPRALLSRIRFGFGKNTTLRLLPGGDLHVAANRAVDERREASLYAVAFEGQGGTEYELPVRLNRTGVSAKGAALQGDRLRLKFPEGDGYHRERVEFAC